MAYTTTDKLLKLIDSKNKIKQAIFNAGVSIPTDTPFNAYDTYINQISQFVETSDLADLMELCDLYEGVITGNYVEHIYTEDEQTELTNLVNLIVEGE